MFAFFLASTIFSQTNRENKPTFSVFGLGGGIGKPIILAKKNDGLPKKIMAKGTIVDASISDTYCGILATAGTLKIELSEKVRKYNNEFLYVVVLCLAGEENENLIGRQIQIEVKKIVKYPYSFSVLVSNSIDSNETPFYLSTIEGIGGLLKRLESKDKITK